METKAHFVLIGAFTLAVILGAFGLVLFFSGLGDVSSKRTYAVVFSGSVSGLARGGPVLFNGIHVGEVTQMDFSPNDPGHVTGLIQVEGRVPIKQDTKARLELQGLTGVAAVALTGGSADAPEIARPKNALPVIYAEPSQIQNLLENVQGISGKADAALAKIDKLLSDNSVALTDTFQNIDRFSKALGDPHSGLGGAMDSLAEISRKVGPLADRLQKLSDDIDKLVVAVDPDKVRGLVDNVSGFTHALSDSSDSLKSTLQDAATLAKGLTGSAKTLDSALASIDAIARSVSPKQVQSLMDGAGALGDTLTDNKGNIDRAIKNASELAAKLNDSADKIDGLMDSLKGFVGSPDVKGPISEIGDAAKAVRQLADELNLRTKEMGAGLTRFATSGLREYESLAIDGRKTIADLDRLLRSLESNPSQIIFGARNPPAAPGGH